MDAKKLFFEADANQIKIKKLLNKEFLELQMNAISSANPNRNNSWFTPESMQRALPSFKNKPILGYFENGDFVSHNGQWRKDIETDMPYWDTLGGKGERILGIIREQDEVKITQDAAGVSWITLTCALWTSYAFKQVQRLIKDAIRAQKSGGPTKHISVEVDITNYEKLDNGVLKINDFVLVGITILGSRNGVPVEPGIEDAELSVVELEGTDVFNKQQQALRIAYEKLEEGSENTHKEDNSQVAQEENQIVNESELAGSAAENQEGNAAENADENTVQHNEADVCPECGHNPCQCAHGDDNHDDDNHDDDDHGDEGDQGDDGHDDDEDNHDDDQHQNNEEGQQGGNGDGDKPDEHQNNSCDCAECAEEEHRDPIHDLAWLINDCAWNAERYADAIAYYNKEEVQVPHKEAIIALLKRLTRQEKEAIEDLGALLAKIAEEGGISDEDAEYECKLSENCDCKELYALNENLRSANEDLQAKYAQLEKDNQAIAERLAKYERAEFVAAAREVVALFDNVEEAFAAEIIQRCEAGEITTVEDVKKEVALHVGMNSINGKTVVKEAPVGFSAPVINTPVVTETSKPQEKGPRSSWEIMNDYISKK